MSVLPPVSAEEAAWQMRVSPQTGLTDLPVGAL